MPPTDEDTNLRDEILEDEGSRACVYADSLGFATIGVGVCVDQRVPGAGLHPEEIAFLLDNRLKKVTAAVDEALPWAKEKLCQARLRVLYNMTFQMGITGLLQFKNTLALIEKGDYSGAALNMLASNWDRQTPSRAHRLAEQMRLGRYVSPEEVSDSKDRAHGHNHP